MWHSSTQNLTESSDLTHENSSPYPGLLSPSLFVSQPSLWLPLQHSPSFNAVVTLTSLLKPCHTHSFLLPCLEHHSPTITPSAWQLLYITECALSKIPQTSFPYTLYKRAPLSVHTTLLPWIFLAPSAAWHHKIVDSLSSLEQVKA
jgi:hypothetical protein